MTFILELISLSENPTSLRITVSAFFTTIFLPPPGNKLDLFDAYNRLLPIGSYSTLYDPHLKAYFKNKKLRKHMEKTGLISKSGKVIPSLRDLNDYREYQRRIQAEQLQQMYRDQYEEEKRKRELELKRSIYLAEQKTEDKRSQTLLRSYIKNAVAFVKEGSMNAQREKDLKVLNRQLRLRDERRNKDLAKQERCERLYAQHMEYKYGREEWKRLAHMEMAEKDIERVDKICRRQKDEQLLRRIKLEDFWSRKADEQIKWLEKGIELENKWLMDREDKIKDRKTRLQKMTGRRKADEKQLQKTQKLEEQQTVTIESKLRDEEMTKGLENVQRTNEIRSSEKTLEFPEVSLKKVFPTYVEISQPDVDLPTSDRDILGPTKSLSAKKVTSVPQISEYSASDETIMRCDKTDEKHVLLYNEILKTSDFDTNSGKNDIPEADEKPVIREISMPVSEEKAAIKPEASEIQETHKNIEAENSSLLIENGIENGIEYQKSNNYHQPERKVTDFVDDAATAKLPEVEDSTGGNSVEDETPRRISSENFQKSENYDANVRSTGQRRTFEEILNSEEALKQESALKLVEPVSEEEEISSNTELAMLGTKDNEPKESDKSETS